MPWNTLSTYPALGNKKLDYSVIRYIKEPRMPEFSRLFCSVIKKTKSSNIKYINEPYYGKLNF